MSKVREPCNGHLKPINVCLENKPTDIITTSLKVAVTIFLLVSISLVFFTAAFRSQTRWLRCPECHTTAQINELRDFPDEEPSPEPTNITHIVFGIGGSVNTWKHRRHYSELWWQPNTTRGYVWLDSNPDPNNQWSEHSPPYRVSEDWTRFKYSTSQSAVRIARIMVETFQLGLPNVRWFVMGDDDTVFFTNNLVSVLGRYDHRRMYYIGGNSESVEQDLMHSYDMAFGGGGFAVSYPLAAELVKVFDGCLDRYYHFYGSDQRVWACVSEVGVSLTKEPGFHQIDIRGDPYGILAAHPVAPLVSLHHLDYVKPLFPNQTQFDSLKTLIQAYRIDPARTVQQCFCYYKTWRRKWSLSISWGYTVQIYPSLLTANELETPLQTFHTWRSWSNGPFTFNTRPMNPDLCEQPAIYFLDWVQEAGNETLTSYKRYAVVQENKCRKGDYHRVVEKIVVSSSKMDPRELKEGPRRECCEINSLKYGKMKVKIQKCKRGETITR